VPSLLIWSTTMIGAVPAILRILRRQFSIVVEEL
jgi:hypothetical protein